MKLRRAWQLTAFSALVSCALVLAATAARPGGPARASDPSTGNRSADRGDPLAATAGGDGAPAAPAPGAPAPRAPATATPATEASSPADRGSGAPGTPAGTRPERDPSPVTNSPAPPTAGSAPPRTPRTENALRVDPASVGLPYSTDVPGLLTFRGNPTRTYYGSGPVPREPEVRWRFPDRAMCSLSTVGGEATEWCGTGWTGQPAVFERTGRTWVVFGAYDRALHFVDAGTGERILPDFPTGDIIKGSVTVDPDGFPLVYSGSRDGHYRIVAFDGEEPVELWRLSAGDTGPTLWNDDWDGSGLVLGDHLVVGGENSRIHVVRLNRGYGPDGRVTVAPELVWDAAGWDAELLAGIGDHNVSIEGSVAVWEHTLYFANSGGLVQGWDLSGLTRGRTPHRTFRFWTGDDTDASVVVDSDGMLYVASEWERHTPRAADVGQIMKLDPRRPDDPVVWAVADRGADVAGVWATPALDRDVLYVATDAGRLLALDRDDGSERWSIQLAGPTWQSPVVVDDVLLQGDCAGDLHAFDVRDTSRQPPPLWTLPLGGCIESTPAVWRGGVYVGTRAGFLVGIR